MNVVEKIHHEFDTSSKGLINSENEFSKKELYDLYSEIGLEHHTEAIELNEKFPLNNLITFANVRNICKKYGLVLARITEYSGVIPNKNLKEIARFDEQRTTKTEKTVRLWFGGVRSWVEEVKHCGYYFICAPQNDIFTAPNMEGWISVHDPIVLYSNSWNINPESSLCNKVFVIVSKWGNEANDLSIQNPIEN